MDARTLEAGLLARATDVVKGEIACALDAREANVLHVAAMVIGPRFPRGARALLHASKAYFDAHPGAQLSPSETVARGWISSLPSLRDQLSRVLEANQAG